MGKNKLRILVLTTLTIAISSPIIASSQIRIAINNDNIALTDAAPYMENGRTYVPIRVISENLGAQVNWIPATSTFEVSMDRTQIVGKVDESIVFVNKAEVPIDTQNSSVTAIMKNERVYVPIRFFAETTGYSVMYDNYLNTVCINNSENPLIVGESMEKPMVSRDSSKVVYKTDMLNKDFIALVPDVVEGTVLGPLSIRASVEVGEGFFNVSSPNYAVKNEKGYNLKVYYWGWEQNSIDRENESSWYENDMIRMQQLLPMITIEHQKVFDEFQDAIVAQEEGKIITTSDGRTFKVIKGAILVK